MKSGDRALPLPAVCLKVNKGKTAVYTDPTFPKPIKTGIRAVAWLESELDEWLAARALERFSPQGKSTAA